VPPGIDISGYLSEVPRIFVVVVVSSSVKSLDLATVVPE
jgi:hypothetical protein